MGMAEQSARASGCRLAVASRAACRERDRIIPTAASTSTGSGKVKRPGLVEDDRIDLGQSFDRIAGVEQYAGAKQRAGGDDLNRRNRERQRARAGDDEDGNRGDGRVVKRCALSEPEEQGRGRRVHGRPAHRGGSRDRQAADSAISLPSPFRSYARSRRAKCRGPAALTSIVEQSVEIHAAGIDRRSRRTRSDARSRR